MLPAHPLGTHTQLPQNTAQKHNLAQASENWPWTLRAAGFPDRLLQGSQKPASLEDLLARHWEDPSAFEKLPGSVFKGRCIC